MPVINVDGVSFTFPNDWVFSKFDEWLYYRAYLRGISGTKAVDLLAIAPDKTAWLIEVKDYRLHRRTKTIDLSREVAEKVHDTLAVLLAARTKASEGTEKEIAVKICRARKIRVVLHLEQPAKQSKLFPRAINPSDVYLKLKSLLKQVDAHPAIVEINQMRTLNWSAA